MRNNLPEKLEAGRLRSGFYGSNRNYGPYGVFLIQGPCGCELRIMAAGGDETEWEHVSVSTPRRPPNWQEMCFVKRVFWRDDETVMQLHPPESEYINVHPHCLHLWRPVSVPIPMPPSILVGPKL
jgi:hypothetical protein